MDIPVHLAEECTRVLRVRRVLQELGVGPGSRVLQLLSLNDLFTLGPLAWLAAKEEGACVLRCRGAARLGPRSRSVPDRCGTVA